MKFEYILIISFGILIFSILFLIAMPKETISLQDLEGINHNAILAKESGDESKLDGYMSMMQEKMQKIVSEKLDIQNISVYLGEFNFPIRDSSKVKLTPDQPDVKVCDVLPNFPSHLETIQNAEMFSRFVEKYQDYPIAFEMMDERYYNSTVHYTVIAKQENNSASTWFHVNSCTGENVEPPNLSCYDSNTDQRVHTRHLREITASLDRNEFCVITFEPWKQKLHDYSQKTSGQMKQHQEKFEAIQKNNPSHDEIMEFFSEMERLGILGNMINHAMFGDFDSPELRKEMQEYETKFGSIPDEFLELIDDTDPDQSSE